MEMPKARVAQALALPFIVSMICGFFLINKGSKGSKPSECLEAEPIPTERNMLQSRA